MTTESLIILKHNFTLMSILTAKILHEKDYGLTSEDLDKIIKLEKMRDITSEFTTEIKSVCEKFDSVATIRILAFNNNSGVDEESQMLFAHWRETDRRIFYCADLSNKDCCVFLVSEPEGFTALKQEKRVLAHEFAHHYQFAYAGFPYYIIKESPSRDMPLFVRPFEVGTSEGKAYVDNLILPNYHVAILDSCERISDIACEGLLRERGLSEGLGDILVNDLADTEDFASRYHDKAVIRYIHRISLRDYAEWGACVKLAFPEFDSTIISRCRKKARGFNKKYIKSNSVFDSIFKLCTDTPFQGFKNPNKALDYMQKIFNLLNITINPPIYK